MRTKKHLIWLPTGGHIGDAVMIVSLFSEVLRRTPDMHIQYLVRRNAPFIADLTAAYPNIIVIPVPYSLVGALRAALPLLKHQSVVIAPPAWGNRPLVIKLLAALLRLRGDIVVGFKDESLWHPYRLIEHDRSLRYIDNLRRALLLASVPTEPIGSPPCMKFLSELPPEFPFAGQLYIVVHPFPHMSTRKTLPLRRWRNLAQELRQRYPSCGLVITGAEADRVEAQKIAANKPEIFLAINLPLRQVAGLIEHAKLYIGIDTGPTHIAGVLQAPSIILAQQKEPMWLPSYNPNALLIWEKKNCVCGQPGKRCEVFEDGKPYRRCVYDLSDETIFAAIAAKLSDLPARAKKSGSVV